MSWNMLTGLLATLIGVAYAWGAWTMPRATFGDPMGHIVYPLILGIAMTLLGLGQTAVELVKNDPKAREKGPKFSKPDRHGKEILFTIGASLVYALLFEPLGYVFSTILYLGSILFLINGKAKVARTVIVAVSFSVGVYVLFSILLGIQLPRIPFLDI